MNNFKQIQDYTQEYFATFSSKEEYLKKRSEWRLMYKELSSYIRNRKKYDSVQYKLWQKAQSDILKKMYPDVIDLHNFLQLYSNRLYFDKIRPNVLKLFDKRLKETNILPVNFFNFTLENQNEISCSRWQSSNFATHLLKVRHEMKKISSEQREKELNNILAS